MAARPLNVLMIVSDTFRKDNLSCYSDRDVHTPHLDRFAEKCVVFDRAYANSFPTLPARADFLTGRYTFTYRDWNPLDQTEITLPQVFAEAGYTTMGVVDTPFFLREAYGFDKGFGDFIFVRGAHAQMDDGRDVRLTRVFETDYAAPATMFEAERWLQRHREQPFFLYADTWDPHEPWDAPIWYTQRYMPSYDGKRVIPAYGKYEKKGMTEADVQLGYAAYRGEVTMVDRWIGRLIDTVEALGLLENTVIIFTSDHGYYFGEHGYYGKSVMGDMPFGEFAPNPAKGDANFSRSPIYEEVGNIPFLMHVPGIKPRHTKALVSHSDIMPTLLDLAGLKIPAPVQGKSMAPILRGQDDKGHEFVVTTWPLYNLGEKTRAVDSFVRTVREPLPSTITTREHQLLYTLEGIPTELYDLVNDPKQQKNIAADNPAIVRKLHGHFIDLLEKSGTEERLIGPRRKL